MEPSILINYLVGLVNYTDQQCQVLKLELNTIIVLVTKVEVLVTFSFFTTMIENVGHASPLKIAQIADMGNENSAGTIE